MRPSLLWLLPALQLVRGRETKDSILQLIADVKSILTEQQGIAPGSLNRLSSAALSNMGFVIGNASLLVQDIQAANSTAA